MATVALELYEPLGGGVGCSPPTSPSPWLAAPRPAVVGGRRRPPPRSRAGGQAAAAEQPPAALPAAAGGTAGDPAAAGAAGARAAAMAEAPEASPEEPQTVPPAATLQAPGTAVAWLEVPAAAPVAAVPTAAAPAAPRPGAEEAAPPALELPEGFRLTGKPPERALLANLRRQIEWRFSDASLASDLGLYSAISGAVVKGGWLSCRDLLRKVNLRQAVPQRSSLPDLPELVFLALMDSHLETWVDAGSSAASPPGRRLFVRRRQPLPPLLKRQFRGTGQLPADLHQAVQKDPHETLNRLLAQKRVLDLLQLPEVGEQHTVFREKRKDGGGPVLAVGYDRVIYGDGGAYVEVTRSHVRWEAWPHFRDKSGYDQSYFDEFFTETSHVVWEERWKEWHPQPNHGLLMLYAQRVAVDDRPWSPTASQQPHAWRPNGYADYRPGLFYFAADAALIQAGDRDPPPTPTPAACAEGTMDAHFLCWDYKRGSCQRGDKCKWRHV